jgi:PRC-barrel domain
MIDPITGLLGDLRRLVLEMEKSQKQKNSDQQDKDKEERPLEGQILTQEPGTILDSKLRNAIVYAPDHTRIGGVNDLLISTNGRVEGIVVGVVGAEKNVALKFERFEVTPQPDGRARVMLSATMGELQNAPNFKFKQTEEQNSPS